VRSVAVDCCFAEFASPVDHARTPRPVAARAHATHGARGPKRFAEQAGGVVCL
jgi:hypothetical protein